MKPAKISDLLGPVPGTLHPDKNFTHKVTADAVISFFENTTTRIPAFLFLYLLKEMPYKIWQYKDDDN